MAYMPLTSEEGYSSFVGARIKDPAHLIQELNPLRAHLLHMAVGISGEAGELLDAVKKFAIYGKPLDLGNVIEELGDLEFYLAGLRSSLSLTREMIISENIRKLSQRYPQGYSNDAAIARADKFGEGFSNSGELFDSDLAEAGTSVD